jgi:hypothetical protein
MTTGSVSYNSYFQNPKIERDGVDSTSRDSVEVVLKALVMDEVNSR